VTGSRVMVCSPFKADEDAEEDVEDEEDEE
jgi:hypothetical protein